MKLEKSNAQKKEMKCATSSCFSSPPNLLALAGSGSVQNVVKLPFGKAIFLKGFVAGCKTGFGSDAGFRHVIYRADSKCYQMDVTACPYVKYCNAEGCGELTHIFCDSDVCAYGYLDGITFEGSQTLGTGGEKCDFHLYSAK